MCSNAKYMYINTFCARENRFYPRSSRCIFSGSLRRHTDLYTLTWTIKFSRKIVLENSRETDWIDPAAIRNKKLLCNLTVPDSTKSVSRDICHFTSIKIPHSSRETLCGNKSPLGFYSLARHDEMVNSRIAVRRKSSSDRRWISLSPLLHPLIS